MKLQSTGKYEVRGKVVFSVKNPIECQDFDHLLNKEIIIDGVEWLVIGVERFTHAPPWREGEAIGLMVEQPNNALIRIRVT